MRHASRAAGGTTCALTKLGHAVVLGSATVGGALGCGAPGPGTPGTTPVADLDGVDQLGAGQAFACAIASGKPMCWGANDAGQLGNGGRDDSRAPVAVTKLDKASGLAVGWKHACAMSTGARSRAGVQATRASSATAAG